MGFFFGGGAAHRPKRGQKGPYPKNCHTNPTMMKLVSYTLPKEDMNHMTHQLGSADQYFSLEISKFCYIKKYTDCILLFSFLILLIFLESLKIVLINMVPISMMSVKKTKLGLLNIKLFWNKSYDVIIYVHDITDRGDLGFKFINLGMTLGTNFKFYTSMAKGLKLKVRKFLGLISTFVKTTSEKLIGQPFWPHHHE